MKLLPEKFLFFLPLRTGGLALGVFSAIAGIVGICGGLAGLEDIVEIFTLELFTIRSLSIITFVVSLLYLFAVYSKRSLIMLPGIIWHVVLSVVVIFLLVTGIVILFYRLTERHINFTWFLILIGYIFFIVIFAYFSIIAISLYIHTKKQEKHPRRDKHPASEAQTP